jgi:hypothetical protein
MEERPWSTEFQNFHLGLFFNRMSRLERSSSGRRISSYLFGINLLIIKTWIVFTFPNFFKK